MPMPLTPFDSIKPFQASESIARVAVSISLMMWVIVILALFWH